MSRILHYPASPSQQALIAAAAGTAAAFLALTVEDEVNKICPQAAS